MTDYTPTLTVGGKAIPGRWDGSSIVALDGLTIDWGAESILDPLPPATLSGSIIDPDGQWATTADLVGLVVTVSRAADPDSAQQPTAGTVVMFRGRITNASMAPVRVQHPVSRRTVVVWRVDFTAADRLADLAKVKPSGPAAPGAWYDNGERYWYSADTITARIAAISKAVDAAGLKPFILQDVTPQLPFSLPAPVALAAWHDGDNLSALDMLQQVYAILGLGRCAYDPAYDRTLAVTCGILSAGWRLQLVGGKVTPVPADSRLYRAPATQFELGDDRAIAVDDSVAIDVIELGYYGVETAYDSSTIVNGKPAYAYIYAHKDVPWILRTPHAATGKGERHFSAELAMAAYFATSGAGGTPVTDSRNVATIANEYYYRLSDLVDKFYLPELRYDFGRNRPASTVLVDTLLLPRPRDTVVWGLTGSLYAGLPRATAGYQLAAGRIQWLRANPDDPASHPRWLVAGRFAPVAAGGLPTLPLSQFSSSTTARFADVDPTLTLADLRNVTTGL